MTIRAKIDGVEKVIEVDPADAPAWLGKRLSVADLAAAYDVSTTTVRRGVAAGKIPHIKVGGQIRFTPENVRVYEDQLSSR